LSLIAVFKRFGETVPRWARNVPSMAIIKWSPRKTYGKKTFYHLWHSQNNPSNNW
jgi:hypothetical protein